MHVAYNYTSSQNYYSAAADPLTKQTTQKVVHAGWLKREFNGVKKTTPIITVLIKNDTAS